MNYTLIIQNTTSKEIYSYDLEDLNPSGIYFDFNIKLTPETRDGEYEYILIPNPELFSIEFNVNNAFKSVLSDSVILVQFDEILTASTKILICKGGNTYEIKPISFGLIKIGDYTSRTTSYNKQNKYTIYER